MPIVESLVALLTSSTAKSVGKYLYQKVDGYFKSKHGALAAEEKATLERQIKELKRINNEIQNKIKGKTEVTQKEVDDLKHRVIDIEELQKKKKLPEVLISPKLFEQWIEKEDLEDRALIARRELDVLIEKALEMGVKETKRWELEEVSNNLTMFINNLRKARRQLHRNPTLVMFQQDVKLAELGISRNLDSAKALLKDYQEMG